MVILGVSPKSTSKSPAWLRELRLRGHHRVAGAQLFGLEYETGRVARERFLDPGGILTDHHQYFSGSSPAAAA